MPLAELWRAMDLDKSAFYRRYLPAGDQAAVEGFSRQVGLRRGQDRPHTVDRELGHAFVAREASRRACSGDLPMSPKAAGVRPTRPEIIPTPAVADEARLADARREEQGELWGVIP